MGFPFFGDVAGKIIDVVAPQTKTQAEELALEMVKTQTDVNLAEAGHASMFVAGWRPYIGWICGTVMLCYYVPYALVSVVIWGMLCWHTKSMQPRPEIGIVEMLGIVVPMLGLAQMRSNDKKNGVETKQLS